MIVIIYLLFLLPLLTVFAAALFSLFEAFGSRISLDASLFDFSLVAIIVDLIYLPLYKSAIIDLVLIITK